MANEQYDYSGIETQLKQRAQQKGLQYDPSDLEDIKRNTGYDTGGISVDQALANAFTKYDERAASGVSGGGQPAPSYATPTQAWNAQPAQNTGSDQLMQLLMQRAQQGTAVDRNSAGVRQQVDPVVAQQERASRNYIDDIAEKSGPLANIQGERRLAAERSGQAAGAFESEVIGREMDRRAQEIQQALSLWGAMLSDQQRMALQKELAYLTDARAAAGQGLQAQALNQSNDQFLRELALRESDQNNSWDYRWATLGV